MRLVGDRLYLPSLNDKQRIERELVGYLNHGLTAATNYLAGTGGNQVATWFAVLSGAQRTRLIDELSRMINALNNYTVRGRQYSRDVQLCHSSGAEMYEEGLMGAAYGYGVANVNSHFRLRVYVGMEFRNAPYDDKVQTIVHELSHRIIQTDDEENAVCSGVDGQKAYGRANATALAGASPDQALNNADNVAYFVCECSGLNPS